MNKLRKIIREEVRRVLETYVSDDIPMPDDKGRSNIDQPSLSQDELPSDIPEELTYGMKPKWYESWNFLQRHGVRKGDLIELFSRLTEAEDSYEIEKEAESWFRDNKSLYDVLKDIGKMKFMNLF